MNIQHIPTTNMKWKWENKNDDDDKRRRSSWNEKKRNYEKKYRLHFLRIRLSNRLWLIMLLITNKRHRETATTITAEANVPFIGEHTHSEPRAKAYANDFSWRYLYIWDYAALNMRQYVCFVIVYKCWWESNANDSCVRTAFSNIIVIVIANSPPKKSQFNHSVPGPSHINVPTNTEKWQINWILFRWGFWREKQQRKKNMEKVMVTLYINFLSTPNVTFSRVSNVIFIIWEKKWRENDENNNDTTTKAKNEKKKPYTKWEL